MAGSALNDTQLPEPTRSEMWRHGLGFSLALLLIMLSHEMGHFLLARRHKVDATWPFFIPAPLLSVIGTLGAVIRLRSLPRTRTALLDIGAAGPIAGFLVTIPVLVLGLIVWPVLDSGLGPRIARRLGWREWPAPKRNVITATIWIAGLAGIAALTLWSALAPQLCMPGPFNGPVCGA